MESSGTAPPPLSILVVDDEPTICKTLTFSLEAEGHRVVAVNNAGDALTAAIRNHFDMALVDLRLGTESGMDLVSALREIRPWVKIVVMTAYASIDTSVEAMRRGCFDYLPKPFTHDQIVLLALRVAEVLALEQKVEILREAAGELAPEPYLTSRAPVMDRIYDLAGKAAQSDVTILIRGESGTGKTVLARTIHSWSPRASNPFGAIICTALSPELLESRLFGHAKGAVTGATFDYPGCISHCEKGTLFLDEISELPLSIQAKLLAVLKTKTYERTGENRARQADVRIIAATNVDLDAAVKLGNFREDLFYRMNNVEITIPPLRERREDILPLADHFLAFFIKAHKRHHMELTEEVRETLENYNWPGNLHELRNAIERAVLFSNENKICMEHLPAKIAPTAPVLRTGDPVSLEKIEEMHIRRVLATTKSLHEACEILGMDSVTLWRRRKKYLI